MSFVIFLCDQVAVVGSGYIAIELAGVFQALGTDTTLMLRGERVLSHFDPMIGYVSQPAFL